MPVAVEVTEGGVAGPADSAPPQAHRTGHFLELPVADVAVHPVPGGRCQEQVEVAVVIEVHEQRGRGGRRGAEPGSGRDIRER